MLLPRRSFNGRTPAVTSSGSSRLRLTVNPELQEQVNLLSVAQLENLAEALLDFSNEADLVTWLDENSNQLD
ncbi:DUF4351 domain-containing protein [Microcoleus sp. FACHB-SPT15]|uniref:DUF4351 domain-containing protein n=1 Tax=Microcoleus sp. FACHB-SPT15 TaxID=2692830 RepID=UPI0018EFCBA1|nr:DUF4351 domain-containing protein [Microcoleus sp. FACHB-SPT15]